VQHSGHEKTSVSRSHRIFYIFSILVFVFCFYYFPEIKSGFQQLKKVNAYWLLAAITAQVFTYLFAAIIYRILLRAFQVEPLPRLSELSEASVIFLFFNQTVPSVGVSGNTYFFNFLVKRNIPVALAFSFMTTELLIFYATLGITILVLLILCSVAYKVPAVFLAVLAAGLVMHLILGAFVLWIQKKNFLEFLYKKVHKLKFARRYIEKFRERLQSQPSERPHLSIFLKHNKLAVLKAFLFQWVILSSDALTLVALFYGLGVPVPVFAVVLSFIGAKIVSDLPLSPGSLILYESSMTFFLVSMGTPVGPAVIVTLLYRLLSFWLPIPVGLLLYRKWQKKEYNKY
jgi:uncharacterized protein (TIRG00374 family)